MISKINEYDLIVIGAGSAGFAAARKANELNKKTLLINNGLPLAGTCLNVGCIPSKRFIQAGEVLHNRNLIPGIELNIKKINFTKLVNSTHRLITDLRNQDYEILNDLNNVTYLKAWAKFLSSTEVIANNKVFKSKNIIIATGSTALPPKIKGLEEVGFITHVEALKPKKLFESLIVIGAGPLGLEFAQMYARFGTKITLLERNNTIFARAEPELNEKLEEILIKEKIKIFTNTEILQARKEKGKKIVVYTLNGKKFEAKAQEILIATGKTPNTQDLGLNKIGIETNNRQAVIVDEYLQTTKKNIYAIGDVNSAPIRAEITAAQEGRIAVENIFLNKKLKIDYDLVPYSLFTDPQLAFIGLSENNIKDKKNYNIFLGSFKDVIKARIINRTEGLIKIIVEKNSREIKGVHILSANAADIITQAIFIIKNKNTIDDILETLPPYPTLSQAIKIIIQEYS